MHSSDAEVAALSATLARTKQASFGEQGCSLSHKATVHMRLAKIHVMPREQSTDRAYQNCFWPLARQKPWKDTMTCTITACFAKREVETILGHQDRCRTFSPAHCAARYAQKAYLTKDIFRYAVRRAQVPCSSVSVSMVSRLYGVCSASKYVASCRVLPAQ